MFQVGDKVRAHIFSGYSVTNHELKHPLTVLYIGAKYITVRLDDADIPESRLREFAVVPERFYLASDHPPKAYTYTGDNPMQKLSELKDKRNFTAVSSTMNRGTPIFIICMQPARYAPTTMQDVYYFRAGSTKVDVVSISNDTKYQVVDQDAALVELEKTIDKTFLIGGYDGGSIGSDPEIFVENKEGALIPAFDFLPSKQKPIAFNGGSSNGINNIYWDGYQAEFDTKPDSCMGWHADSIQQGLKGVLIAAKQKYSDAKLSMKTTFDIPHDRLDKDAEEHVSFGCMPSLNIYGLEGIKTDGRVTTFRSAGGHIHFGFGKKKPEEISLIVRTLDMVLGVACVSMFAQFDDARRRTMYGLPGEHRLPPHGMEYRVLSNAWLSHPLIANLVFDLARTTIMFAKSSLLNEWVATEEETIGCIMYCDVDKAREILKRNEKLFNLIINSRYHMPEKSAVAAKIFMEGMETAVVNPHDVVGNWRLEKQWNTHSNHQDLANLYAIIKKGDKAS